MDTQLSPVKRQNQHIPTAARLSHRKVRWDPMIHNTLISTAKQWHCSQFAVFSLVFMFQIPKAISAIKPCMTGHIILIIQGLLYYKNYTQKPCTCAGGVPGTWFNQVPGELCIEWAVALQRQIEQVFREQKSATLPPYSVCEKGLLTEII